MYIIDESYFIKEIRIPNASEIDVSGSTDSFDSWIDQQARLCLQNALGSVLFADFDSNVTNGVLDVGAPTKWLDLVNGKTYTKDGYTYIWKGLAFTEGTFKGSLLAYFTYCKWLEFQLSQQTGMGEARGKAVNSMSANSTHRYVMLWNAFVEMYQGKYSETNTLRYIKGVPVRDYYGGRENNSFVSLVEYLKDNEDDYPDPLLIEYNFQNTFGF